MGAGQYRFTFRRKVAVDVGTYRIRVASEAFRLLESSSRSALHAGVIVNAGAAVTALQPLLAGARTFGVVRPHVLACAPSDVTAAERERLITTLVRSGAASVVVVPEPLAAAIGAEIDVSCAYSQMVIDIGEGVTDCAVMRSSRVIASCAVRSGCSALRRAVAACCGCGDEGAEVLLRSRGVVFREERGSRERACYREALSAALASIDAMVAGFLREMPARTGAEVIDSGIVVTGGGALLPGMVGHLEHLTGIRVVSAARPLTAVVRGAQAMLPVVTALNQWP